jgi:hypothetical protein
MDNSLRMSEIVNAASPPHSSDSGSSPAGWSHSESTIEMNGSSNTSTGGSQRAKWKPVVLLMPARYGLEKLTERYVGNLKQLFKLPQFLGIAGGRPGRSLYFVATQGEFAVACNGVIHGCYFFALSPIDLLVSSFSITTARTAQAPNCFISIHIS